MSAQARRAARADAAHAAATAPARWFCRVEGCIDTGPHPTSSRPEAFRAADAHYAARHATPPPTPEELSAARAAWVRAGRPPLGEFPATP